MASDQSGPAQFDQAISAAGEALLKRVSDNSPFLAGLIERQDALAAQCAGGAYDAALAAALAIEDDDVGKMLRLRRQGVALVTALADLSGAWDLTRVTRVLSDFADNALDRAIETAIGERYDCEAKGFAVIALGKHGGRELNYSSDIDPIFLFDPQTLPRREREEPQQAAVRIGKRVIELLNNRDEHGYVFRVDMRLRPTPEVSPIAIPVNGAISYYESSALAWEQAAFIRARACAGDLALGEYFLRSIDSFVWRRSLDFGQIDNIRKMTAQIRSHFAGGQTFGPGYDLKKGRGGIRECEFFAQAHQLIHGGREKALRVPDTREALAALAAHGAIAAKEAKVIAAAYEALRMAEHRLQMIDDRQTHSLPADREALDRAARLGGLADGSALLEHLRGHVDAVAAIYDALADDGGEGSVELAAGDMPLQEQLSELGYADPADAARRIARWRSGKLRAIRSDSAVAAFEAVLPDIMRALAQAPDPEKAIARFDNLVEKLPSAINFFHLLLARPALLQLLADILSYAPVLADALARKIDLLDRLVDASALELPAGPEELSAQLEEKCAGLPYELKLDRVRDFVGEHRFALGVQLIEGQQFTLAVARSYAHLAEAALKVLAAATIAEFEEVHGRIADSELVILALGRLGGEALTHASDLDLVFLFTGDHEGQSDGRKPLGKAQYFNRLAQRIIAALSVQTASGALYEVDTRLRPSGEQGLPCVSLAAFARYQQEEAWAWEHMALTRGRCVFGSRAACAELSDIVTQTLTTSRHRAELPIEVTAMRRRMAENKKPKGALDIKLLSGGLVDLEFLIHYLQLREGAALHPQLPDAISALVAAGHLPGDIAPAHDLLTKMLVTLRLVAPDCEEPGEAACVLMARAVGQPDWQSARHAIEEARGLILRQWEVHLGPRDF